uniref:Uncharacterized protein n=1 Tax=Knipowitschia caucasica TaxID=637954 RepID=A0AAV2LPJ7_KNICA
MVSVAAEEAGEQLLQDEVQIQRRAESEDLWIPGWYQSQSASSCQALVQSQKDVLPVHEQCLMILLRGLDVSHYPLADALIEFQNQQQPHEVLCPESLPQQERTLLHC